jgi:hypothetical protein
MAYLAKTYLYRLTHIDNLPHILVNGLTHWSSLNANPNYRPIGDSSLIGTRKGRVIPFGKPLGDYLPFYFAKRTPMLYVIQNGYNNVPRQAPTDLVYCVTSVEQVINLQHPFIYTNGHATDVFTQFFDNTRIGELDSLLDWNAIRTTDWKNEGDLDLKRRMQAEFLLEGDLPFSSILGFLVHDEAARQKMIAFGFSPDRVHLKPDFYF